MLEHKLCRLCLSSGCRVIDIFEDNSEVEFVVKEVIEDLLRIKVVKEALFPWMLCHACCDKMMEFNLFKDRCVESLFVYENRVRRGNNSKGQSSQRSCEEIQKSNAKVSVELPCEIDRVVSIKECAAVESQGVIIKHIESKDPLERNDYDDCPSLRDSLHHEGVTSAEDRENMGRPRKKTKLMEGTTNVESTPTYLYVKQSTDDIQCQRTSKAPETVEMADQLSQMYKMMEKMEKNMSKMCSRVESVEFSQREILDKMSKGFRNLQGKAMVARQEFSPPAELPFSLPMRNYVEFCETMAYLENPEVMEQLQDDLGRIGGKDETSIVNGILSKLMTNNFAKDCNWKGMRSGKYTLETTPMLKLVRGATVRNIGYSHVTEDVVKERIQRWLSQASKRKMESYNPDDQFGVEYKMIIDDT